MDAYQVISWMPLTFMGIVLPFKNRKTKGVYGDEVAAVKVDSETGQINPSAKNIYTWNKANAIAANLRSEGLITEVKKPDIRIRMCP